MLQTCKSNLRADGCVRLVHKLSRSHCILIHEIRISKPPLCLSVLAPLSCVCAPLGHLESLCPYHCLQRMHPLHTAGAAEQQTHTHTHTHTHTRTWLGQTYIYIYIYIYIYTHTHTHTPGRIHGHTYDVERYSHCTINTALNTGHAWVKTQSDTHAHIQTCWCTRHALAALPACSCPGPWACRRWPFLLWNAPKLPRPRPCHCARAHRCVIWNEHVHMSVRMQASRLFDLEDIYMYIHVYTYIHTQMYICTYTHAIYMHDDE
jgi:hypothetical protein